jgi:enoyl-CoA hydratase/carnithine racemase
LEVRVDGAVLVLTLDRPERRNALTAAMLRGLDSELRSAAEHGARAIVLTGRGSHFCSGADTRILASDDERQELVDLSWAVIDFLAQAPLPVVGALNGPATGGGLELALSCDVRIATPAFALQPRGVEWGAATCTRLGRYLPLGLATQMIWLQRSLGAEECLRWGLLAEVVDGEAALGEAALGVAQRLADLPRETLLRTREMLRDLAAPWSQLVASQAEASAAAWRSDPSGVTSALGNAGRRRDDGAG